MRRARRARATGTVGALVAGLAAFAAAAPAHGVLPPAFGGTIRLPLASPLEDVDPTHQTQPSSAGVAAALFDTLYALDARGAPVPVLAESLPVASATPGAAPGTLHITLRSALRRHDGQRLVAADVVASLRRAMNAPRAAWLLGAIATAPDGALDLRATSALELDVRGTRGAAELARVLAARPLAIVVRDPHRRAVGTGPFALRGSEGGAAHETVLVQHDPAALGAAFLERITLLPPRPRDDDLRSFELGETDASWFAARLYAPAAPNPRGTDAETPRTAEGPAVCPVMLVTSETGVLREPGLRGYVANSIDRRRLERAGLSADATLAGLPVAAPPTARAPGSRVTLRLAVPTADPLLSRVAEAIAAMLDERGVSVVLSAAPALDAPPPGTWDARLVSVLPPLPGPELLVGAALAAAGRVDAARALMTNTSLDDSTAAAAAAARQLDALVLGRRRETLYHRAALRGVRFELVDGALDLPGLWLPRLQLPVSPAAAPGRPSRHTKRAAPRSAAAPSSP